MPWDLDEKLLARHGERWRRGWKRLGMRQGLKPNFLLGAFAARLNRLRKKAWFRVEFGGNGVGAKAPSLILNSLWHD
jgi:hypothetical protein